MQLLLYVSPIFFIWIFIRIKSSVLKLIWFPVFFLYCCAALFIPLAYILEGTFWGDIYSGFMLFFVDSYGFMFFSLVYILSFVLISKTTDKKAKATLLKHSCSSAFLYFITCGVIYLIGVVLASAFRGL